MARKYARDNRGRFASKGTGATARGGRLKTAGGNKRQTQTMRSASGPSGTVAKPRGLKPGSIKPKQASKRGPATSGASFERRANALTPAAVESRRMKAEMARPMQFYKGKAGGKAESEFNNRIGQASYNRQQQSINTAIQAKRFYAAAAQFNSEFTARPRYRTVTRKGPDSLAPRSLSSMSAWAGYKGRGGRK